MKAKKHLGQNFLHSKGILRNILVAAELSTKDAVLEVGPGKGFLTEGLLEKADQVIAVEKDSELIKFLKEKFTNEIKNKKFILIEGDIRDLDFKSYKLETGSYKLIANIPYYITGEILRFFLQSNFQPSLAVLMVQKEVADRIVAGDGKESILSISVKAYGRPKVVKRVGKGNFNPVPKVDSAILKIENISKSFFAGFSEEKFFEILHAGFAHKRKKLSGNLSEKFGKAKVKEGFNKLSIKESVRAENVAPKNWADLAKYL